MTTNGTQFDNETNTNTGNRGGVRAKASDAYDQARERTSAALDSASERAGQLGHRAADGINANPVGALIGGLALGAILAALLPKTQREEELLGDYGRKINDTARDAARAAREAGVSKLDELGYNRENAKGKIDSLKTDAAEIAAAAAQRIKGDVKEVASAATQNVKDTVQT